SRPRPGANVSLLAARSGGMADLVGPRRSDLEDGRRCVVLGLEHRAVHRRSCNGVVLRHARTRRSGVAGPKLAPIAVYHGIQRTVPGNLPAADAERVRRQTSIGEMMKGRIGTRS